tara:strand:+ start:21346 stop:22593 length:1248 start_codon:yes stop_codon:yes gene_type:complete
MNEEFDFKRRLGTGRWDKKLIERLTALSVSDNYSEARFEWRATGKVWLLRNHGDDAQYATSGNTITQAYRSEEQEDWPAHLAAHPYHCLCGHSVVWHFEIENMSNGAMEIVGSDHIDAYLIIEALKASGLQESEITDELIEKWINEKVKGLKAQWWWDTNGELFEMMFNNVKEMDLRANVRITGRDFDHETSRYEELTAIRKSSKGEYGGEDYKMASIVWRWNHPDNPKAQVNTRGFPTDKLWLDLLLFNGLMEAHKASFILSDKERMDRIDEVVEERKVTTTTRLSLENKKEIAADMREEQYLQAFTDVCEYYNFRQWTTDEWKVGEWAFTFMKDMRYRMERELALTERQINAVRKTLATKDSGVASTSHLASPKQINYINALERRAGLAITPVEELQQITKQAASERITELKH